MARTVGSAADEAQAWAALASSAESDGRFWAALLALRRAGRVGADVNADIARVRVRVLLALGSALGSAALIAAAAPSLDLWPLGLVGLVPLYLTARRMPFWSALLYAGITGFTVNLYGFSWTIDTLARFAALTGVRAMGILVLFCLYQASTLALPMALAAFMHRRASLPWCLTAPLLVALAEAVVPFVFPWNLGITVWRAWPLLQVAELGGPAAVSALVVLINVAIGDAARARFAHQPIERATRIAAYVATGLIALGLARAGHVAWLRSRAPHVRVAIVQPNFGIVPAEERKQHGQQYIDRLRAQTDEAGRRGASLVVWPESSFPFLFDRQLQREFAPGHPWELRSSYHGDLLIGALTHGFGADDVYNSALLVAPDGRIAGRYDKVRLMPFGEYIPMSDQYPDWASSLRKRLPESPEIAPGSAPAVLSSGNLRIAPMICYEDILPETARDIADRAPGANLLVTLVNHAWFGTSLAPRESLALATLRSVELRRDLVRAANTGVSSVGDALGRVRLEGPLLQVPHFGDASPQVLDADVALLDGFAFGPLGTAAFPYLCGAALVVALARRLRAARVPKGR